MATTNTVDEAIEVLQQLGLSEYEARCFVGLTQVRTGTAKQLAEITEVPRTRVYDAIRVLEAKGLVEIHHSSPQQYRAVSLTEAAQTLRDQYEDRVQRLQSALESVDILDVDDETPVQQVWAIAGRDAIENRTNRLIQEADGEVVLVLGDETLLTRELVTVLTEVPSDVDVVIGALTETLEETITDTVPNATTFVSGLEWLRGTTGAETDMAIGRLLLVDRTAILVSTLDPDTQDEQAVFGEGFGNGLVVIARRLMAQGLLTTRDPAD